MHTAFTVTDIKLHINISFEYFWFLSRWHLTHKYIKPDWLITASHLRHLSYYKNMLKETWRLLFKTLLLKILVAWLLCIANVALRWVKYMNKAPFTLVESASGSSRSADPRWARGWQVHDHSAVAERIRPTVLYGLSNRNRLPVLFHPTVIWSNPPDGWGMDQLGFWQVSTDIGHLSVNICHPIESNGWSNQGLTVSTDRRTRSVCQRETGLRPLLHGLSVQIRLSVF